jgi:peptidyl-prolyl cis-trans isomerase SurA
MGTVALAQEPVAIVNGEPIEREELESIANLSQIIFTIYQQFPSFAQTLLLTEEGEALLHRYELDILEQLIRRALVLQEGQARSIEPAQETVDQRTQGMLDQIIQQNRLEGEEGLAAALAQQGRTLADFREEVAQQVWEQLVIEQVQQEVTAAVTVTEEEIQGYYEDNPSQFMGEEGEPLPLEEVRDQVVSSLLSQKRSEAWRNWLAQAREAAEVTINL